MADSKEALDIHLATLMSQTTRVSNQIADLDKTSAVAREQRKYIIEAIDKQATTQHEIVQTQKDMQEDMAAIRQDHELLKQRVDDAAWWGKTALGAAVVALVKGLYDWIRMGGVN